MKFQNKLFPNSLIYWFVVGFGMAAMGLAGIVVARYFPKLVPLMAFVFGFTVFAVYDEFSSAAAIVIWYFFAHYVRSYYDKDYKRNKKEVLFRASRFTIALFLILRVAGLVFYGSLLPDYTMFVLALVLIVISIGLFVRWWTALFAIAVSLFDLALTRVIDYPYFGFALAFDMGYSYFPPIADMIVIALSVLFVYLHWRK